MNDTVPKVLKQDLRKTNRIDDFQDKARKKHLLTLYILLKITFA